jgi:putative IMPACT (imprinted ancient) family translation regulator
VHTVDLCLHLPYAYFDQILKLAGIYEGIELEKCFAEEVTLSIRLQKAHLDAFDHDLQELTRGQVTLETLSENTETTFPIL